MSGLLTICSILIISYLIALGLSAKSEKEKLKEKALRLKEKEEHSKEVERYELEILNLLRKG